MMDNNYKKITIVTILIFSALVPIILLDDNIKYNTLDYKDNYFDVDPNANLFSDEEYVPLLDEPLQGLGNITITKFTFNEEGFFNQSEEYPNLVDDLSSGALNITYQGTKYLETIEIAQFNNLDESVLESDKIMVSINESISIQYNSSIENSEGFLIYNPRLFPRSLKQVFV